VVAGAQAAAQTVLRLLAAHRRRQQRAPAAICAAALQPQDRQGHGGLSGRQRGRLGRLLAVVSGGGGGASRRRRHFQAVVSFGWQPGLWAEAQQPKSFGTPSQRGAGGGGAAAADARRRRRRRPAGQHVWQRLPPPQAVLRAWRQPPVGRRESAADAEGGHQAGVGRRCRQQRRLAARNQPAAGAAAALGAVFGRRPAVQRFRRFGAVGGAQQAQQAKREVQRRRRLALRSAALLAAAAAAARCRGGAGFPSCRPRRGRPQQRNHAPLQRGGGVLPAGRAGRRHQPQAVAVRRKLGRRLNHHVGGGACSSSSEQT
jgi:hypothetical protein